MGKHAENAEPYGSMLCVIELVAGNRFEKNVRVAQTNQEKCKNPDDKVRCSQLDVPFDFSVKPMNTNDGQRDKQDAPEPGGVKGEPDFAVKPAPGKRHCGDPRNRKGAACENMAVDGFKKMTWTLSRLLDVQPRPLSASQ